MLTGPTPEVTDFRVLYVDNDSTRSAAFGQAFGQQLHLTTAASRADALNYLRQSEPIDILIINDELGGMKLLDAVEMYRMQQAFATILLCDRAATDTSVQPTGQPIIDVFPLDYEETLLRGRLTYFTKRKAFMAARTELERVKKLRLPVTKRLFDVITSGSALLILSPVLLVVAVLIRLDSKGPVFYRSKRIGMGYKPFDMIKFRTMRTGADTLLSSMASQNIYQSAPAEPEPDPRCQTCLLADTDCQRPLFQDNMQICEVQYQRSRLAKATFMKFKEDPRVTRLGKVLRNTSIDELPQLYNILRGDMSVVGNRPLPPYEAEKLTTVAFARRFSAPAGLTGLWQVTKRGRAEVSDQERIHLDGLYAKSFSLKLDLLILIRTVKAVFQKENV